MYHPSPNETCEMGPGMWCGVNGHQNAKPMKTCVTNALQCMVG